MISERFRQDYSNALVIAVPDLSSHHVDVHQSISELEFPDEGMRDRTLRVLLGHHPAQGGTLGEEVTTIKGGR